MQNIFIELLPPWIETGLQPAFYDKESGTVLQQVSRMWAKMIQLGQAFNTFSADTTTFVNQFVDDTNATVNEYIAKFVELHDYVEDYFANLDVQEEINNKLDAMVDAGTLQEIITTYIQSNVAWTFDTVADMKQATNLVNGSYARTLGFNTINDGGGAVYYITDTGTANEMDVIAIGTLRANLVLPAIVTPEMFGASGGADDTNYLKRCFAVAKNIKFNNDYTITDRIDILSDTSLDGNSHTITNNTAVNCFRATSQSGITVKNLKIVGDNTVSEAQIGLNFTSCTNIIVNNVDIQHTGGDGVYFNLCSDCVLQNAVLKDNLITAFAYNSDNIVFQNINCYKPRFRYGIQFKSCQKCSMQNIYVDTPKDCGVYVNKGNEDDAEETYDIYLSDIVVENQGGDGVLSSLLAGIVLANGNNHNVTNAKVTNGTGSGIWCSSNKCSISNVITSGNAEGINTTGSHISITSCNILENTVNGIAAKNSKDLKISGCYFYNNSGDTNHGSLVLDTSSYITLTGNIFELDGVTASSNNILVKTSISYAYIVGNVFKHYGGTASYADYRGVYDFDTSIWKSNGSARFNNLKGLSTALTAEWDNSGLVIYGYRSSIPPATFNAFSAGDRFTNKSGSGYMGWVYDGTTWHSYGAIV